MAQMIFLISVKQVSKLVVVSSSKMKGDEVKVNKMKSTMDVYDMTFSEIYGWLR